MCLICEDAARVGLENVEEYVSFFFFSCSVPSVSFCILFCSSWA